MNPDIIKNAPSQEFTGVFYFTNATDEDFSVSWNSVEYTFKANTMSPLIISGESLENIQNIRKLFARKLAEREFFKSPRYFELKSMGNGLPPIFDEKELEPFVQACLAPLPIAKAETKELPKQADDHLHEKVEVYDEKDAKAGVSLKEKGRSKTERVTI